jgi:SAM-dependent methyltransferase
MTHAAAAAHWEANAAAWTTLAGAGYDRYRDLFNTPAFLDLLPPVAGLAGLDVGCGDGSNTRLLAARGAGMTGLDVSPTFVAHARRAEAAAPLGIDYHVGSAEALPFPAGRFDFVTSFMCLMDVPHPEWAVGEAFRVLKPGGFLQFSVSHPCFATPHRRNLRGPDGRTYAFEVGDYFRRMDGEIEEWIFSSAPPSARAGLRPFRVPRFTRTLSEWLNLVIDAGFVVERAAEPCPSAEVAAAHPEVQDARVAAYFLHLRGRKPAA